MLRFCLLAMTTTTLVPKSIPSSVEIQNGDRPYYIQEGDNFTLSCRIKYVQFAGQLNITRTTQQHVEEELVREGSSLVWESPGGEKTEIFDSATTKLWPRSRNGITVITEKVFEFENANKSMEGVYKCRGRVVIRQRHGERDFMYSRNSSDAYYVHVYRPEEHDVYRMMRPEACVQEGQKAEWTGSFNPGKNITVTSWEAYTEDEVSTRPVNKIPGLTEKSSITYQLDGKLSKFGFGEFTLTNERVDINDPRHYFVTAIDENNQTRTNHLELIVASSPKRIIEISRLDKTFYKPGDLVNVTCTLKRTEAHENRFILHFAKCDDVDNCSEETYSSLSSIIFAYSYGNPCWFGLPSPPPRVRTEEVTILNFKVETSGVFFCGKSYFSTDARMPLRIQEKSDNNEVPTVSNLK